MNSAELSDQEIAQTLRDDPELFGVIIDRYQAKLERYVRRISSLRGDALQDLIQDIFSKAYVYNETYDPRLSYNSWIYRIAHNETINLWKREKKRLHPSFDGELSSELVGVLLDDSTREEIDMAADQDLVKDALSKLKIKDSSILTLRFFDELSYGEISDVLKIPEGTVATNIYRAKKKLRREIETLMKTP